MPTIPLTRAKAKSSLSAPGRRQPRTSACAKISSPGGLFCKGGGILGTRGILCHRRNIACEPTKPANQTYCSSKLANPNRRPHLPSVQHKPTSKVKNPQRLRPAESHTRHLIHRLPKTKTNHLLGQLPRGGDADGPGQASVRPPAEVPPPPPALHLHRLPAALAVERLDDGDRKSEGLAGTGAAFAHEVLPAHHLEERQKKKERHRVKIKGIVAICFPSVPCFFTPLLCVRV